MSIHRFRKPSFFLLLAIVTLLSSSRALATNRTVTSLADSGVGTLRNAITASDDGDTIDFSVTGVIGLTSGEILISANIIITGPGANLLEVTRNSSDNFRIFKIGNGTFQGAGPTVSLSGIAITNGHDDGGAGVWNLNSTLTLTNCIVSDNVATTSKFSPEGGGLYNDPNVSISNLTVINCIIRGNSVSGNLGSYGGGISNGLGNAEGVLVVRNSTVTGNQTSGHGGGIYTAGTATISNCTLDNNTAGLGGAVAADTYNMASLVTLRNCTVTNNSATNGGAISNSGNSDLIAMLTVSNSTVAGNAATGAGGGIYNVGATGGNAFVMLDNTILQTGAAGANLVNFGDGTSITSEGYNLSSDNGGGFLTAAGDQINTNPQLGPLQDNGGPTQTMALLPGSPALDQGKNFGVSTDQRGLPRPTDLPGIPNASGGDGSDIGAVEMQSVPMFVVTTIADHDDGTCSPDDCTLREAINLANAAGGADTITFAGGITGTIILVPGLGTLTVTDSLTITGPGARLLAVSGSSAIRVFSFLHGTSAISGLTVRDGMAVATAGSGEGVAGGGISNSSNSTLSISSCAFSNNHVQGAANMTAASLGGKGSGGGVANSGTLTLTACTFGGNSAAGGRGGDGSTAIGGNVHGGNGGDGLGGAIFNDNSASLTISNCTIASNSAAGGAGGNGMFGGNGGSSSAGVYNQGTMMVTSATLTGNGGAGGLGGTGNNMFNDGSPGVGRGGVIAGGGASIVRNTIIAGNTADHNGAPDVDGTFTSQGYNLVGIGDSSTGFNATADQVGTNAAPINAMLGSLQDNGGNTDTVGLLTNSPAVDKGNSFGLGSDQRGLSLFDNPGVPNAVGGDGRDIGAFELNGGPPLPTILANISTRLPVETGDNALIGGFIVTGTQPKKVIVRAIGPSLGLSGALADPILELHGPGTFITITNDNWRCPF